MTRKRIGVVGAGIVGLAHAWAAARRGHRVTVYEKNQRFHGASVRNFGMVWPIGQPAGEPLETALESRSLWLQFAREAGHWALECGSIHLAHREDEWRVLEEFASISAGLGYDCRLLGRDQVLDMAPGAQHKELLGGLFSSTEVVVNPRKASEALARWLRERWQVEFHFGAEVCALETGPCGPVVRTLGGLVGEQIFDRVVVCAGSEFRGLFPHAFAESGLRLCKLQMLKTVAQSPGWRIGPHLASGLTLRHYQNFEVCPGLRPLRERIARETPELDRFGIHVMASQTDEGGVILGDSHEYDADIEPFDKNLIDDLILRELRKVISLPDWTIAERWHGVYAKTSKGFVVEREPLPGVHVCTGTGGSGMTMSQGIAERFWKRLAV